LLPTTGFGISIGFDDGSETSPSYTIPHPIVPDKTVLGHKTSSITSSFTQNHSEPPKSPISECFSWADDAEPPTMTSTTPTKHPRDLSGLRSSSAYPFSSLRHCRQSQNSRRFASFQCQHHCYHRSSKPYYHSLTPHLPLAQHSSQPPSAIFLDWDQDSCLADLSNALRALSWARR
jgi:hypothetical protein